MLVETAPHERHRGLTNVPEAWSRSVATRLRAIFELLRGWNRLTVDDCAFVGRLFVYPSLVQWLLRATPACPAGLSQACQADCSRTTSQRLCGPCEGRRPWRLQATVALSSDDGLRRWAEVVWRRIVDAPESRDAWTRVAAPHRGDGLAQSWEQIQQGIRSLAPTLAEPTGDVVDRIDKQLPPEALARYVLKAYQTLESWIALQQGSQAARQRLQTAVVELAQQLRLTYRMGWPFLANRHARKIAALLETLEELSPELPTAHRLLTRLLEHESLSAPQQREVLVCLANDVLPVCKAGLPGGDPLDQPAVQDLFWHRIGTAADADAELFVLHDWAQRHWRPTGLGHDALPVWRTRP